MSFRADAPKSSASRPNAGLGSGGGLLLTAFIALALTLRSPITAIAPVINELRAAFTMSSLVAGLLTSIPVFCYGAMTPLASQIIARTSVETSIFVTLAGSVLGMTLRSSGGIELALLGTVILGMALTIGNIVSLLVIARDFSSRARLVTGIYTAAINVGTMLTSGLTAPLASVFGWRMALAGAVVLVVPTMALWLVVQLRRKQSVLSDKGPTVRPDRTDPHARPAPGGKPVWRRSHVWMLMVALAAHLFIYYGLTAWLPAYLMSAVAMTPSSAGLVASLFQILALLGSFGIPALAGRFGAPRLLVGMAVCWTVTPLGLFLEPQAWLVWAITCGIATGGGFTAIFMLIMNYSRDLDDNRRISSLVQGGAYGISALGPMIVGSLNQAHGGWSASFLLLAGVGGVMLAAAIRLVWEIAPGTSS